MHIARFSLHFYVSVTSLLLSLNKNRKEKKKDMINIRWEIDTI